MIRSTNTLVENYTYVSKLDEAVDTDCDEFKHKWELYLDGKADPPLRPGGKPTVWHLQHLSLRKRAKLNGMAPTEFAVLATAMALVKAEGWVDMAGKPIEVEHQYEDGVRVTSEKTLEVMGDALCGDIAMRVIRSFNPSPRD